MSIFVVRAFLRLRSVAATHRALADKLDDLEERVTNHDEELRKIFGALRRLIAPPLRQRRAIGFSK